MTGYESKRAAAQDKLAQPAQEPVAVYGYCPECGAKSVMRERRPNGNDKCANGHTYPSNTSTPPQPAQEPVACAECERLRSALKRANGLAEHFERAWYLRGDEIEQLNAQPAQEPVAKYCCHVCFDKSSQTFLDRMILCSECGNKRCPKATNHALPCTNSNNPLQPAQEPVAWLCSPDENGLFELPTTHKACKDCFPVYTTPPQRKPLTDEELDLICEKALFCRISFQQFARSIEAAHGIKENT